MLSTQPCQFRKVQRPFENLERNYILKPSLLPVLSMLSVIVMGGIRGCQSRVKYLTCKWKFVLSVGLFTRPLVDACFIVHMGIDKEFLKLLRHLKRI